MDEDPHRISRGKSIEERVQLFGLPPRPFFYTIDQAASLLSVDLDAFVRDFVYFVGVTPGVHKKDYLRAVNLAPLGAQEHWRIEASEFVRWLRTRNLRIYERDLFR